MDLKFLFILFTKNNKNLYYAMLQFTHKIELGEIFTCLIIGILKNILLCQF